MRRRRTRISVIVGASALLVALLFSESLGWHTAPSRILGRALGSDFVSSALSVGFAREFDGPRRGPTEQPIAVLRLRDADPNSGADSPIAISSGSPLDPERVSALLDRLPELAEEPDDQSPFEVRAGTKPPPLTGDKVALPFPPPQIDVPAPTPPDGPLRVTRYAPAGAVPMAANLSITFSEPMVALGSTQDALQQRMIELTPQPEGRWRWLGTKTLIFEPAVRFPAATRYQVVISAGVHAASGNTLEEKVSFEFETPPVKLLSNYPTGEAVDLTPLLFMSFDQRVDPKALIDAVRLEGRKPRKLRIATEKEIEADARVVQLIEDSEPGRWVVLKPKSRLKPGRRFKVVVEEGARSAEGPRATERPQQFEFATYDELAVENYSCRDGGSCAPGGHWWIRFNNPLDDGQEIELEIEPKLLYQEVEVQGRTISISGLMDAKTKYRLVVPADLRDHFGQTLGKNAEIEITTGPAARRLYGHNGDIVTIDPFGPAVLPIYSSNNKEISLRINRVEPKDWHAFNKWNRTRVREEGFAGGEVVNESWIEVDDADQLTPVGIDFRPHLDGGLGHFVVWVETADRLTARKLLLDSTQGKGSLDRKGDQRRWARLPGSELVYWVQVTELGLTAMVDDTSLVSWVTSLRDGSPVAAAKVSIDPPVAEMGLTDDSGIARQRFERSSEHDSVLVARRGRDSVLLRTYGAYYRGAHPGSERLLWYHFTDRGVYRPGEEVRLKGWMRSFDFGPKSTLSIPDRDLDRLDWMLRGPRGETIAEGSSSISALGGFDFVAKIPDESDLGSAMISLTPIKAGERLEESSHHGSISIQEFRRPEFEVTAAFAAPETMLGDTAVVSVGAKYFAGGGLSMAPVNWDVSASFGSFSPPHHDEYSFGPWIPWWGGHSVYQPELETASHAAMTDAKGEHRLAVELVSLEQPRSVVIRATASVQDRNRQSWSDTSQSLVHPAELYVGLKAERTFVESGAPLDVENVVVSIGGERVSGIDVQLRVEEAESFVRNKAKKDEPPSVVAECATTSESEPASCRFEIDRGGSYRVIASIEDAAGRRNESELQFWVAGQNTSIARTLDREHVQLIPDRKEYQPGDVAEILVQAPFSPAEGLLILGHNGILGTETFQIKKSTHTLRIPIREAHLSGLNVAVELVGQSASNATSAKRPRVAFAGGDINLAVPPRSRSLEVRAVAQQETLAPGSETVIDLHVADANGDAIEGAEVALIVVDESILALTDHTLGDPLHYFYPPSWDGYVGHHQRSQIALTSALDIDEMSVSGKRGGAQPPEIAFAADSVSALGSQGVAEFSRMAAGSARRQRAPIQLRSEFSALALFAPLITTDVDGRATAALKLPDSVTRYRVMAVAVSGERLFGKGESQITARLPLMVRPSPPRFLNFGDRVELPIVLQNQTDDPLDVEVAVRATNATFGEDGSGAQSVGSKVRVPPNDRVEIRFDAAPISAETARFQVAASTDSTSDASSFDFPVWTPATSEATATYGVIDEGAIAQPISPPASAWPQVGGLEITTSSTQLQALTDAMLYLNTYAFDCSEQISSRMLSIVALKDVLSAFAVEGMPDAEVLRARIDEDLETLATLQNSDGGFGFWRQGERSWPYVTIHIAHAISRARSKGFATEFPGWKRVNNYVTNIDSHIRPETSKRSANALRAYALYVRSLNGDIDRKRAQELVREEELSIESLGWLLPLLETDKPNAHYEEALLRLTNNVTETAAGAHFVTSYTDGAHVLLHSERRADGVVLGALVATDAHNDLVPKLVRGLLDHRKRGRWNNTQENVFILLALSDYFDRFESDTPDFAARMWLGDAYAGEHRFKGRTTDRVQLDVPMAQLLDYESPSTLTLQKQGVGRLYYRVGMRYAPKSLTSEAEDFGFEVNREYEAVDDPDDVMQDDDGTWHIKAGARVRVTVTMVNPMRRYHVALVDPLPAGLEPINSALATSERLPHDEDRRGSGWWYGHWYEHENLRDERVEAFTSLLREGAHTYRYFARATTPGTFVVPPARAEEMYHPETFGRSSSLRLIVE